MVVFRGVPYAQAPIGSLRLRPPEPPGVWSGVVDATRFGPSALQSPPPGAVAVPALAVGGQDEDCLTLNVVTPAADGARRPVLVWIHGGGFDWGSGAQAVYGGERLAARGDVVVVSFNYRLGSLGFLPLAALGAPLRSASNVGLLDQVAALVWVRENISVFGGDPDDVTLFGESAGAISIACLLAMPSASGLFHKAILQSGSLQPLHEAETAETVVRELLGELWLAPSEADDLAHVPPQSLLLAQTRVAQRLRTSPEWLTYRPFVDGTVLPRDPFDAIQAGVARGVPLLLGTNRDECRPLAMLDPRLRPANEAALHARVRVLAPRPVEAERVVAAYRRAASGGADLVALAAAIETDVHFRLPAIRLAEAQARHERRTFMYRFDWPSPALGGALGACHGLEVPFVFGRTDAPGLGGLVGDGEAARALADSMMDAWIAFARSGDPSCAAVGMWPAYDAALRATMRLAPDCALAHDPGGIERRAWAAPGPAARAGATRARAAPMRG